MFQVLFVIKVQKVVEQRLLLFCGREAVGHRRRGNHKAVLTFRAFDGERLVREFGGAQLQSCGALWTVYLHTEILRFEI